MKISNWRDPSKTAEIAVEDQNPALTTDQQRLPRRNRVLRENINIRRGSNTSLRLSSHSMFWINFYFYILLMFSISSANQIS